MSTVALGQSMGRRVLGVGLPSRGLCSVYSCLYISTAKVILLPRYLTAAAAAAAVFHISSLTTTLKSAQSFQTHACTRMCQGNGNSENHDIIGQSRRPIRHTIPNRHGPRQAHRHRRFYTTSQYGMGQYNQAQNAYPRRRGRRLASRQDVKRDREGRGVCPPVIEPNTCRSAKRRYSRHTRDRQEVITSGTGRCPQGLLGRFDVMQIQTRWQLWPSHGVLDTLSGRMAGH